MVKVWIDHFVQRCNDDRMSSGRRDREIRSKIEMAPLGGIAVVLVLVALWIPRTERPWLPRATSWEGPYPLIASIDGHGSLWLERTLLGPVSPSTLNELDQRAQAAWHSQNNYLPGELAIRANAQVEYRQVRPVLDYLRVNMAATKVTLAIAPGDGDEQVAHPDN